MSDDVEFNTRGLDQLLKALKPDELPTVKLGVLGNGNQRKDSGPSNAEILMKHEFGDETVPMRSVLRMPLIDKMQEYLDNSGAFDKEVLNQIIQKGTIVGWVKKIAITAESIVSDAFDSGGFGKWKPSNMEFKKNHQTLVETQQMRNSITSEVKE